MPKLFYRILFVVLIIALVFFFTKPSKEEPDSTEELLTEIDTEEIPSISYPAIVLDAGHGGIDPGKVGIYCTKA